MTVYATMSERMTLADFGVYARRAERLGYDGLLVPEGIHDGLLLSLAAHQAMERERAEVRDYFGLLYSTPAYWPSIGLYCWGHPGRQLLRLSKENRWSEMPPLIRDDIIDQLVPTGRYDEISAVLNDWYGGLVDGLTFPPPDDPGYDAEVERAVAALHTLS